MKALAPGSKSGPHGPLTEASWDRIWSQVLFLHLHIGDLMLRIINETVHVTGTAEYPTRYMLMVGIAAATETW